MKKIVVIIMALYLGFQILEASYSSKPSSNDYAASSKVAARASLPSALQTQVGILRPREDFVQDVLGISEPRFGSTKDQRSIFDRICQENFFNAGNFRARSLAELRHQHKDSSIIRGSFNIIEGDSPCLAGHEAMYARLDIGSLQASLGRLCQSRGKRLTVMVASNLNCLETVSQYDVPGDITRYIFDRTQGPAASISAAPGALLRNYFINHPATHTDPGHQINLLDDLVSALPIISVNNGYLKLPNAVATLNRVVEFFELNNSMIKVGVHTDITVSHGLTSGSSHYLLTGNRPLINQIFCAALDIGQGTNECSLGAENIARLLLLAQIEATIYAAAAENTEILIIPLLGCGVFGNKPEWIVDALEGCARLITASGMCVVLNVFDKNSLDQKVRNRLTALARGLRGSYLTYVNTPLRVKNLCTGNDLSIDLDVHGNVFTDLEKAN